MSMFSSGSGATVTQQAVRVQPNGADLIRERTYQPTVIDPLANPDPAPTSPSGDLEFDPTETVSILEANFPWLTQIGFSIQDLRDLAVEAAGNANLIVSQIRQSEQYRTRFPAIRRSDGSLRMNEGQYLQMETDFRRLLRQAGVPEENYSRPQDLVAIFESEQDTEEFAQRLDIYAQVRDAGDPIRDAFYVYAGIDLTVDDLFEAIVDENVGRNLQANYLERTRMGLDYETFINRTTEVALDRLSNLGVTDIPAGSAERIRTTLDVLYSNAGDDGAVLSLEELVSSFEASVLASEATSVGLELPDLERVKEFRAAGVQRAQAKEAYRFYSLQGRALSANAQRAGRGAIDQSRFEDATFLGDASASRALQTSLAYAESVGQAGGGFRFGMEGDDIVQAGLR